MCQRSCAQLALKLEFCDALTIEDATRLIETYAEHLRLDSLSCLWFHGVFLDRFPGKLSNSKQRQKQGTGALSFDDFATHVKRIPAVTYSLAWPSWDVPSATPLKLCLSSILSEISIGAEHDIVVHFQLKRVHGAHEVLNALLLNQSYFPFVAVNFFDASLHRAAHNFDFDAALHTPTPTPAASASSWSLFRRDTTVFT